MVGVDKATAALGGLANAIEAQTPVGQASIGQASIGQRALGGAASELATPFSGVLKGMIEQTQTLGKKASDTVSGLLSGQGVEVHDVMIAQQKADAAFELALQVRNKAVGAYQQLMGMQF